jgi:hypothetical protein
MILKVASLGRFGDCNRRRRRRMRKSYFEDLPSWGIEPQSPALKARAMTTIPRRIDVKAEKFFI